MKKIRCALSKRPSLDKIPKEKIKLKGCLSNLLENDSVVKKARVGMSPKETCLLACLLIPMK